ncbi:hypothetical protein GGF46_003789 [Coemansia sp. RSA 552]|nr:hypothetical protein GGF46_003789 [Coemansia sp. RSA 552]
MPSLAAATADTVRIWDLESSETPHSYGGKLGSGPGTASIEGSERTRIAASALHTPPKASDVIEDIACVSWNASGGALVVGGRGTHIRQYGRGGEALQDIKLNRKVERTGTMDVVAAQHFGSGSSELLFVANNTARQVRRWDFARREYTSVCQTHENAISCLAVCTKKRLVASATAQGGEIALFNLLHNTRTDLRSATHRALTCIAIAPGHRPQISVGSEDGLVQLFDATRSNGAPIKTLPHMHSAPLRGLSFHPLGHATLVTAGLDKRVAITDTSSYRQSAGNALDILTRSPLTCISCSQDPLIVGTGTIDGEVLVYDMRKAAAPLWSASLRPNQAVVSMDITRGSADSTAASAQPIRRSASQREPRVYGSHGARSSGQGSSDEGNSQAERRPARGSVMLSDAAARSYEGRVAPPAAHSSRGDAGLRPPQHPSIGRFRAAVNEARFGSSTGAMPKPAALPPVPPGHSSQHSYTASENGLDGRGSGTSPSDIENMSIMAKDRSYMDLLSPAKPSKSSPSGDTVSASARQEDILSLLSDRRASPQILDSRPLSGKPAQNYPPALQPQVPSTTRQEPPRTHDAGDSIMEMFTPERQPRTARPAPTSESSDVLLASSPSGIAQTLVSQLLAKQAATHNEHERGPGASADLAATTTTTTHTLPDPSSGRVERQSALLADSVARPAPKTDSDSSKRLRVQPTAPSPTHTEGAPVATATDAPRPAPGALGSVSTSVLHNAIADALAPLGEQIRDEIRNLHLDMIRQGVIYQEQIKALRQECSDARELRHEIEQLRRDNEQLRQYIPFFQAPDDGQGR